MFDYVFVLRVLLVFFDYVEIYNEILFDEFGVFCMDVKFFELDYVLVIVEFNFD